MLEFQLRQAWTTSKVHGAPTPPPTYEVTPAFPRVRFERPPSVEEIPGEKRLLVTDTRIDFRYGTHAALQGVAADSEGRVFVCDRQNKRVVVLDSSGKLIREIPLVREFPLAN